MDRNGRSRSAGTITKRKAADRYLTNMVKKVQEGTYVEVQPTLMDDVFDRWLEHSPLMHVGKVKTPTLLMTGELDLRTPMGQTEEYYQALKAMKVPTTMLRFNGEYHGTGSKPSNFMRTQLYLMGWFDKHRRSAQTTATAR